MKMLILMIISQLIFILLLYIIAGPGIFFSQVHLHYSRKTVNRNIYNLRCNSKIVELQFTNREKMSRLNKEKVLLILNTVNNTIQQSFILIL